MMSRFALLALGVAAVSGYWVPRTLLTKGRSCVIRAQIDEDGPLTPEGFDRIRERQRQRAMGAPISEWAKSSDRAAPEVPDHVPVPPTADQTAAVNALFEKVLTSDKDLPDGFGEGLENLGNGRPKC